MNEMLLQIRMISNSVLNKNENYSYLSISVEV